MLTPADIYLLTPISWHSSGLFVTHETGPCPLAAVRVLKSVFIYLRENLAQVTSCRARLAKFRAGSFLKLKFYRALAVRAICRHARLHHCCDTFSLQPCLQPLAPLCPRLGITSSNFCPCLPSPSPQHIPAALFLWISCHVFYAARFMMAIYAKSLWWVHLSAQLTTGINHSLNTLVSAEPIKIL